MTTEAADALRGVIAILTSPDGHVIATETDFGGLPHCGYTLRNGQEYRAINALKYAAVRAYCSRALSDALDGYAVDVVFRRLKDAGHRVTIIPIGHKDDER